MKKHFLLSICLLSIFTLSAQISPGELSNAHANLEGVSNCTNCHTVGNKVTNDHCLACHPEIRSNQATKKGYHGSVDVMGKNCFACHNEHHGRTFRLINFNKKTFDHRKTGFELKGVHATLDCQNCHQAEHIANVKLKQKRSTYLGLNKNCLTCHDDFHQGNMSSNCLECHRFDSFKNPKAFDHNKTHFPLLGKHKTLNCKECHKNELVHGKIRQGFKNLRFANCNACHQDVHDNKFGQNCKKCHQENSFTSIRNDSVFNHDKTDFPLLGKHRLLECKQCHQSGNMTKPLKHGRCSDCHQDITHRGEFAVNGKSPDCAECHDNNGFLPSTYTVERHNASAFKLSGAHEATSCMTCHYKEGNWHFRTIGKKCVDCHKDEHQGLISEKFYKQATCTECHNESNWKTVSFDHNQTKFKLDGKHAELACKACHYAKNDRGEIVQKFEGLSTNCNACHTDEHAGQFEVDGKTDCARCHQTSRWKDSKFDHNSSRFKLEGAHQAVACAECHKLISTPKGTFVEYKFKDIECSRCHQ
ncbi:MAG TPA: cytochrome c3 family protein [Bacteroidales bacterium]|nr:cytochrome c3 family protein [Bacteroidales bacterium]